MMFRVGSGETDGEGGIHVRVIGHGVTARGTKHLGELADVVKDGGRAVMFYLVQRGDCEHLEIAAEALQHDFRRVFVLAALVGPFARLQLALNIDLGALLEIILGDLREVFV